MTPSHSTQRNMPDVHVRQVDRMIQILSMRTTSTHQLEYLDKSEVLSVRKCHVIQYLDVCVMLDRKPAPQPSSLLSAKRIQLLDLYFLKSILRGRMTTGPTFILAREKIKFDWYTDGTMYTSMYELEPMRDFVQSVSIKFEEGSVMVWGMFSAGGVEPIVRLHG